MIAVPVIGHIDRTACSFAAALTGFINPAGSISKTSDRMLSHCLNTQIQIGTLPCQMINTAPGCNIDPLFVLCSSIF